MQEPSAHLLTKNPKVISGALIKKGVMLVWEKLFCIFVSQKLTKYFFTKWGIKMENLLQQDVVIAIDKGSVKRGLDRFPEDMSTSGH